MVLEYNFKGKQEGWRKDSSQDTAFSNKVTGKQMRQQKNAGLVISIETINTQTDKQKVTGGTFSVKATTVGGNKGKPSAQSLRARET